MSADEGQNGSAPGGEGVDLAALRASLRCGRSRPVVRHLAESDDVFTQRYRYWRDPTALCGAEVVEPGPDVEDLECLGCRDCVRYCPDCVHEAHRWSGESAPGGSGDDSGCPAWCSPRHCYRTDEGECVHQSAPARWEDCEVRFEITLVGPEDDECTYVELRLASRVFAGSWFYAAMPVPAARRLCDELTAHLAAAAAAERHQVAPNWVAGVAGHVMTSSGLDAGAEALDSAPAAPGGGSDSAP